MNKDKFTIDKSDIVNINDEYIGKISIMNDEINNLYGVINEIRDAKELLLKDNINKSYIESLFLKYFMSIPKCTTDYTGNQFRYINYIKFNTYSTSTSMFKGISISIVMLTNIHTNEESISSYKINDIDVRDISDFFAVNEYIEITKPKVDEHINILFNFIRSVL